MRKSKRYWIFIIVLLIIFAGIVVFSFTVFFQSNARHAEKTNLQYLKQDSQRLTEQINIKLQNSQDYLKNIAAIFADSSIENTDEMQRLLENLAKDAPFDNLYFTYPNGKSYRFSGENSNVSDRSYFQKALEGKDGITEPFVSRMTGKEVIVCYKPVVKEKKVCAVLIGVHFVKSLQELLKSTYMGENVYSAILNQNGQILVGSNTDLNQKNLIEELQKQKINSRTALQDMKQDMEERKSGQISYAGIKDTSVLIYNPLEANSWYIIQNLPSVVLQKMKHSMNLAAIHLALGLALSFCILYLAIYLLIRKRHSELYVENQRVHAIIDSSYSLIFEYDENEQNMTWYGDARGLFDKNNDNMDLQQIIFREDKKTFQKQLKDLRHGAKPYTTDIRLRKQNGKYLWCNCQLVAIRSLSGHIIKILGIIRDIDIHKAKEFALAEERDLLNESINLISDTYYKILMLDLQTEVCKYIKIAPEELACIEDYKLKNNKHQDLYNVCLDMAFDTVIHPEDIAPFKERFSLEALRRELSREHPQQTVVYRRKANESSDYKWAQAECILCEKEHEAMIYVKDITEERIAEEKHKQELKRAFQEVSQANRVKTDFLEYISHDLRTPMNAIIGMNDLTRRAIEEDNSEKAKYYTERVNASSEYLMALLRDIIDVSHFQKEGLKLECEPFSMDTLSEECREFFEYVTKEKQVSFQSDYMVSGCYIGDLMRIRQLMFNLIENAVKFNKPGGSVLIQMHSSPGRDNKEHFQIVVRDTGIGMDRAQLERLFEPFSRGKRITSETYSGTGIGLTIVKSILDAMEGTIHVESTPMVGTTIDVQFDLIKGFSTVQAAEYSSVENRAKTTVLTVDDNLLNLEIAEALLENEGYHVLTANSGMEALEIYKRSAEGSINVLLTDISMPEMDGYQLSSAVRAAGRSDSETICIIALTAFGYEECRQQVIECGMNAFLNKPFEVSKFNKLIESNLSF